MNDLNFLSTVDILQGLNDAEIEKVHAICKRDHWEDGEMIFAEGDDADKLCFVISGMVGLRYKLPGRPSSKQTTLATVAPGGTFGWSAFVEPFRYTLSSFAVGGPVNALVITRADMTALFESEPRIGFVFMRNLTKVIGQRFNSAQEDLSRLHGFELTADG